MIVEPAASTAVRSRFTRATIAAFLPDRGRFTFPSPYDTTGIRVTNVEDCPGGIDPIGYSYWSQINNHRRGTELLVVIGLNRQRGGQGPTLFAVDKATGDVERHAPLFDLSHPLSWSTGEGWYFSATRPTILYLPVGNELRRYDVLTHESESVFTSDPGTYLWQCHSSADDRVHSATLRRNDTYEMLGAITYREDRGQRRTFEARGAFDECQIDKSGVWLVIKENDHNRILDLETGIERLLRDEEGAVGHSDCGYGYLIGEDDRAPEPGTFRRWQLTPEGPTDGAVVYHMVGWSPMSRHVSHNNAQPGSPESQSVIVSCAHREDLPRANEIVRVPLDGSLICQVLAPTLVDLDASGGETTYAKLPKASVDITGEYVLWSSNAGGDRLDAFLVYHPSVGQPPFLRSQTMIAFAQSPILAFETGELIPGQDPGTFAVVWPLGSDTVLSVQPDGRYETRPRTAIGPWESAKKIGDKLVYNSAGAIHVVPIVEGL
jgi:hypothetical protein